LSDRLRRVLLSRLYRMCVAERNNDRNNDEYHPFGTVGAPHRHDAHERLWLRRLKRLLKKPKTESCRNGFERNSESSRASGRASKPGRSVECYGKADWEGEAT